MRRNNPQEATTRRATPRIPGVLCCFSLYNTPRTKQQALKALYISRNQTGNLKDEADFVAGASAMLGMINKVLFGATESEEMNIVPAGWFIYMMSGRGLSELFEEKENNEVKS